MFVFVCLWVTFIWSSQGTQTCLIVSSIGSPCYALAGFLHKILNPIAGKSESFVKN
jgi:hypothetical protein